MPDPINFLEPESVLAGDAVVRTDRGTWAHYSGRVSTLAAESPEEVGAVLDLVEQWAQDGGVAVGYVAYEAGRGLDPALVANDDAGPYAQFALFGDAPREYDALAPVEPPKQLTMVPGGPKRSISFMPSKCWKIYGRAGYIRPTLHFRWNWILRMSSVHGSGSPSPAHLYTHAIQNLAIYK